MLKFGNTYLNFGGNYLSGVRTTANDLKPQFIFHQKRTSPHDMIVHYYDNELSAYEDFTANNVNTTFSSVKLSTATDTNTFVTSALPNLNEMTFIAPSYGPYETYSALIDDGDTIFCAEVDSGCCMKVVRNWNDDRNKDCWCGLPQETYFYIG